VHAVRPQPNADIVVETVLAHDDGVRTLYRYMRYPSLGDDSKSAQDRRTWVERVISHGEIYFPLPPEFNDPFETRPHFRIPRRADGSIDADVYIRALHDIYGPRWGWTAERIAEAEAEILAKIRSGEFEPGMEGIEAKWSTQFRTEYPMCCLTRDRDNVPMWSYYGASHTGVCVHLDATVAPFGAAMKVVYRDEYPFLPQPLAGLPPKFVIQQALLTKARAWRHEREYRLIDVPNYDTGTRALDPPVAERLSAQLFKFRPRHIVGVTCGALMQGAAIERIARVCGERAPRLPVYQAGISKHSFALIFEEIRE
jgi:hypothetical protein